MKTKTREIKLAKRRRPSLLDEVLERRMLFYVLAAGATLAGASSAHAKVVFTPSNAIVNYGQQSLLLIDLSNDGTTDFELIVHRSSTYKYNRTPHYYGFDLWAMGVGSSDVIEGSVGNRELAALRDGEKIGSNAKFDRSGMMVWSDLISSGIPFSSGPFANTTWRFIGLRFPINGQVHYGWIGFRSVHGTTAKLYGWAYETQPNKPIFAGLAGAQEGSAALRSAEPTSLELLAAGHVAVADWRRRTAAVTPSAAA